MTNAVETLPTHDLVVQAQAGDRLAMEALAVRYRQPLVRYAMRYTGSAHDAEDVAQNVLVKMFTQLQYFQGKSALETWLFRIAFNEAMTMHRRRSRIVVPDALPEEEGSQAIERLAVAPSDPHQEFDLNQTKSTVCRKLERLPKQLKEVLHCYFYEELSFKEIGKRLGISEAAAKARACRARQRLKQQLVATYGMGTL